MAKMRIQTNGEDCRDLGIGSRLEWLLADGAGGFAMGSVSGLNTRRYHGLLVAAIRPPADRMVLLDSIEAFVDVSGTSFPLSTNQYPGAIHPEGFRHLQGFVATDTSVEWTYDLGGREFVRTVSLTPGAVRTTYENRSSKPLRLTARPLVCNKPYHGNFRSREDYPTRIHMDAESVTVEYSQIGLRLEFGGATCQATHGWYYRFERERERERGLDPIDDLFCPCELTITLEPGQSWTLAAEAKWPGQEIQPERAESTPFLVHTRSRTSIIAGYPWFTDWGRDTMISLPGICLADGLIEDARQILRDYASQLHQGLIPNRFVEVGEVPEYNTVDASLWFANAAYLTLKKAYDESFAHEMLKAIQDVVDWYRIGTLFGIAMDPADGLITQGTADTQLTWMDAKVGDHVVTPRYGKPVEINGLWINTLRVLAWIKDALGLDSQGDRDAADLAEQSFHLEFWNEELQWYRDTVDPISDRLRPNQVIPLALDFGPLHPEYAEACLQSIETHLATPVGLRTLAPFEAEYRGRFEGTLPELDSAYHQGTVWPWLLGMYALAHRRVRGAPPTVAFDLRAELCRFGLGGIAEVYDGDAPHRPNGCPWQAWSVATWRQSGLLA